MAWTRDGREEVFIYGPSYRRHKGSSQVRKLVLPGTGPWFPCQYWPVADDLASPRPCLMADTAPRSPHFSCPSSNSWVLTGCMQCSLLHSKRDSHSHPPSMPLFPVPTILLVHHFWLMQLSILKSTCLNLSQCQTQVFWSIPDSNQYLSGCSASEQGRLPTCEHLTCTGLFFRNVILRISSK